jgi:iron complex outermembrane receptor protein
MLLTAFARANNLLDEEIRHHTSFIKDEAPRPGRNFTIGARVEF